MILRLDKFIAWSKGLLTQRMIALRLEGFHLEQGWCVDFHGLT